MIKRIKIKEFLKIHNLKNVKDGKIGEKELGKLVNLRAETISRYNTGAVPKSIECLWSLSEDLNVPIKDLWNVKKDENGNLVLVSIKIDEALEDWNSKNLGSKSIASICRNLNFTNFKIHCWKKTEDKPRGISESVIHLFNICNALNCDPNEILELYENI